MHVPPLALEVARRAEAQGGRAYLVGGCVRDHLLGIAPKDIDLEIHGVADLEALVNGLGHVNAVGKSFGVLKVRRGDIELDVSLPRRDSKVGPGHRGIQVEGDPDMGLDEAVRRRDLTVNALLYDPLTGQVIDIVGGVADVEARLLREVDETTFGEDPLRALRAVQFAARFDFTLAPSLAALCRTMPLDELPHERIRGELDKLLLKSPRPSIGLQLLVELGLAERILPTWSATPQVLAAVDRSAKERFALYGALFHGLDAADRLDCLEHLRLFEKPITRTRFEQALALTDTEAPTLRALADDQPVVPALTLHAAVTGRSLESLLEDARRAGVADGPLPRLLDGAALRKLGVPPGPRMGALLDRVRNEQHAGRILSPEDARQAVAGWLTD
ncbi:MAG: CCA tRNA nucleotidyltransferase [Proteobacteria bacterium]|nr:CCA tRNA nucleotidyltransferase [Pseudomonadota bacterium]MCP4915680.1 CCA tRNA nucleotidyltransferase [Pseudomonadota bacterium]